MIIFLYGLDSYRIKENLEKILESYAKKNPSGVNVFSLDFSGEESVSQLLSDFEQPIKTVGFFDEKKILVVKNAIASSAAERLVELIERWKLAKDENIIVVFAEALSGVVLAKKHKKLFNLLEKKAQTVKEFELLVGKQLENWVVKEFETVNAMIESAALQKLLRYVTATVPKEGDPNLTWRLKQEIDKLAAAASGGKVRGIDVEALVVPEIKDQVFSITDALADKNRIKYFSLLYGALERGMDASYVFSMIIFQFRNLLNIKSLTKSAIPFNDLAKQSGLHPFVVRKTYDQARKFELDELKQIYHRLATIEIATKSGLSDLADELYSLAFNT